MRQQHFSEKKRQLKVLVQRFHHLLMNNNEKSSSMLEKLLLKIKKLVNELKYLLSGKELKRILGAAILFLGISFHNQVDAQSFAPPVQNPFGIVPTSEIIIPAFADLDNDGDMDLLAGEYYGRMNYYENTGTAKNPLFASPVLNPFGLTSTDYQAFPAFTDLDSDGDLDLLVGEYYGNMKYFENIGSPDSAYFAPPALNPFALVKTYELALPTFADLDNDGDMDLLVGEYYGNMQYFENTGSPESASFAPPVKNPFGLVPTIEFAIPQFADLDDDGDMDLLVGEYYGNVQYFENLENPSLIDEVVNFEVRFSPNPTKDKIAIETDKKLRKIEIYTLTGKRVAHIENDFHSVSLKGLKPGMYLLHIVSIENTYTVRKVFKQ